MALPNTTVEIAFDSGYLTPAASRTWTDVSAYVEGALPVGVTRGRADEVSQVQASRLVLTLDNRDGRFTPRLASGAYYPNVKKGRPIRVTSTYNGVDYVRFTGYVSEWPVVWPDGTDVVSSVTVTCVSRMGRLGRGGELRSVVEEEVALDDPVAYYTLGEPEGSTSAADSSGSQAPALTMTGSGADVVFGTATGPGTDGLTAAEFSGGKYLRSAADFGTIAGVECSFTTSTAALAVLVTGQGSPFLQLQIDSTGHIAAFSASFGFLTGPVVTDGARHTAALRYDGTTVHLLLDGAVVDSTASVLTGESVTGLLVGGDFIGSISHVALFAADPGAARLTEHAEAMSTGFAGETSGARIDRFASFAGIPTAEVSTDAGEATIGHFDITGMTPVAAMQRVTETENGVLYDAKDGTLTFEGRDARYTASSSFTLDCTSQQVEADLSPVDDDQFLVNDVTATANGTPAGHVVDPTSIEENGYYRQDLDTVTDDVDDALQGANWKVYQGADPEPRYSTVTVDVTNSSTALAASVMAADIGTRFTLSNLPTTAPSTTVDLFVEGYTETITATSHRVTFNTSPADGYDVWTIEDPVFGAYDEFPLAY